MDLKKWAIEATRVSLLCAAVYLVDPVWDGINRFRNVKIYDRQNLTLKYTHHGEIKKDFEYEKKKLGLDDLDIHLRIVDPFEPKPNIALTAYNVKTGESIITVDYITYSREALKHELCHVKSFSSSKFPRWWVEFPILRQYEEWTATSCSL